MVNNKNNSNRLEVLWKVPIVPDTTIHRSLSFTPMIHGAHVVFNSEYTLDGVQAPVLFLDTANGSVSETWSDHLLAPSVYFDHQVKKAGRFLFLGESYATNCIDLDLAKTAWQTSYSYVGPWLYVKEGYIYRSIDYGPNDRCNAIVRSPVGTENWQTLYSFCDTSDFTPGFNAINVGVAPNGDTLVFWKNRSYASGPRHKTDIYAWNLSGDSLLWVNEEIKMVSSIIPSVLKDTILFGVYVERAFAIGLNSGKVLWRRNFNDFDPLLTSTFFEGDLFVTNDAVIYRSDGDETVALDPLNGHTLWRKQMKGEMRGEFVEFEGNLWFISDRPRVIDPRTGVSLLGNNRTAHLQDLHEGLAIDSVRRVMYFHDRVFAYCVRLPEEL